MNLSDLCCKCGGREFLIVDEVQTPHSKYVDVTEAVTLTTHRGLVGDNFVRSNVGLRAKVCASCAYVELYARDLERLGNFADAGVAGVRRHVAPEPDPLVDPLAKFQTG